jgi:menaquinone-specific isochorismate synthase
MTAIAHARKAIGAPESDTRISRTSWFETARNYVCATLAEAPRQGFLAITVPAPVAPIEAPLRAMPEGPAWIFAPPEGVAIAAHGVTTEFRGVTGDRFVSAREASKQMLDRIARRIHPDALAIPMRAFVGFSFSEGGATDSPWAAFGDALVLLPRWTYAKDVSSATLTLAIDVARHRDDERILAELETWMNALERGCAEGMTLPNIVRTEHIDRQAWAHSVDAIRSAIAHGELGKVVAARRSLVITASDLDPLDVFARLAPIGETRSATTRFLVRVQGASFVGATPEHLFTQRGIRVTTEALAGSIAADAERGHERLHASEKDLEEHAYVVRHLTGRLEPLAARIAYPEIPQIRVLPTVLHLRTPIEAELSENVHPIDLIAKLHPTPAVGGTPVERAVPWISEHEPPRGWYGAPLGWIDERGDAEIVVALRCGVITGNRAWLWAGGGIVSQSNADAEWEETALKMRPMLRALGAT